MPMLLSHRPRRLRRTSVLRALGAEHRIDVSQLIYPLFVQESATPRTEIPAMAGQYRWSPDALLGEIERCMQMGLGAFALFPVVDKAHKDRTGEAAVRSDTFYLRAIAGVKQRFPEACVVSDVALDPYHADGHDGLWHKGEVVNDATLPLLAEMALLQAEAGADIVAPSDMMDGRVGVIRQALEKKGHHHTVIMAYTAKYASGLYAPFRSALDSAPAVGDKKGYQLPPDAKRAALTEATLDEKEGADVLMIKPALPYLDVIAAVRAQCPLPVAAYQVSGEYAMIKAAAQAGWIDEATIRNETLLCIKRAGADMILSYFAKDMAKDMASELQTQKP